MGEKEQRRREIGHRNANSVEVPRHGIDRHGAKRSEKRRRTISQNEKLKNDDDGKTFGERRRRRRRRHFAVSALGFGRYFGRRRRGSEGLKARMHRDFEGTKEQKGK